MIYIEHFILLTKEKCVAMSEDNNDEWKCWNNEKKTYRKQQEWESPRKVSKSIFYMSRS